MQESNEIKKQQNTLNKMNCDEFLNKLIENSWEKEDLR